MPVAKYWNGTAWEYVSIGPPGEQGEPGPIGPPGSPGDPGSGLAIVQPEPPPTVGLEEGSVWVDEDSSVPPFTGEGSGGLTEEDADLRYLQLTGGTVSGPINSDTTLELYGDGTTELWSSNGDLLLGAQNELRLSTDGFVSLLSSDPIWVGFPGGSQTQKITNLAQATDPRDAVSKEVMDAAIAAAGGGLQTRATVSKTTASLAAGASEAGTITLAKGYRLYRITTGAPARVRLYTTASKQTADTSRPIGTDPVGDHGQMLEFVSTAGLLAADLSPVVDGFDGKTTPDGIIPISVTNTGTGAAAITVTFTWIRSE